MRVRSGIAEIDQLEDVHAQPAPALALSLDDVPRDAYKIRISRKTRGLAALADYPNLRHIMARSAGEAELEHIGRVPTLEHLQLGAPTCVDLRVLSRLSELRTLSVSVGTRLESLEGIEGLAKLRMVTTWTTPRLSSIDALEPLRELRIVFLAGGMYKPMRIPSLHPLAGLDSLIKLHLSGVRVADCSLRPLAALTTLRRLNLSLHFPVEEFAMLELALPQADGHWRDLWRRYAAGAR
jgi:hypothetical protein